MYVLVNASEKKSGIGGSIHIDGNLNIAYSCQVNLEHFLKLV